MNEFLVSSVRLAKPPITSDTTGSVMCYR